jgi:hypothetical protein
VQRVAHDVREAEGQDDNVTHKHPEIPEIYQKFSYLTESTRHGLHIPSQPTQRYRSYASAQCVHVFEDSKGQIVGL